MGVGTIFLIGGPKDELLRKVGARAIAAARRKRPRVAALYAPIVGHGAGLGFMKRSVADMFPDADVHRVILPGEERGATEDDAKRGIDEADVIFVSGGDPIAGAKLVLGCGADRWLHTAVDRGASIVGASAGSIILGAWWASWPDDPADGAGHEHEGAKLVACTRVAPGLVLDAHDEADDWAELRAVARMVGATGEKLRFVGLPTGGAIEIGGDGSVGVIGKPPFFL